MTFSTRAMRLSTRLVLAFGVLLVLLCTLAAAAAWLMHSLVGSSIYYATNLVPSYEAEYEITNGLGAIRRLESLHVLSNSDAEMTRIEGSIDALRKTVTAKLETYQRDLADDPEDHRRIDAARVAIDAYYAQWGAVRAASRLTAVDPHKIAEATRLLIGDSAKAFDAANAALTESWAYNVEIAARTEHDSLAVWAEGKTALAVITLAALAIGVAATVWLIRSVMRDVGGEPAYAAKVTEAIATGNLTLPIRLRDGDTSSLLHGIRTMRDSIAGIVGQVRRSSDSIATGSTQIATGNADLSQRTEEQASNVQQTAASMEQLSSTVRLTADTAAQAHSLASEASTAAVRGGERVSGVVGTMHEIAASSKKVSDIIGVIDGIAFQTNILALNAAVEAARAGEQGRGFAVVASEVRSLAGRSAEAAREIKALIGASTEKVEAGARQVDDAGRSMSEIVEQVRRVSEAIGAISNAAREQSIGIGQVGDAVTQLDRATQQNAALVEESAVATESLKLQAAALSQTVGVFQIGVTA